MSIWAFGLVEDEEHWDSAGSREDAINEGRSRAEDNEQDHFFIAPGISPSIEKVSAVMDGDLIVEALLESNMEQMPEGYEDTWLAKVSPEQLKELEDSLNTVIKDWLLKHKLEPTWWNLGTIERIEL